VSPEEFAAAQGVSRETLARLKAYVGMLEDWNARHNLVSRSSLEDVWRRHVLDSAQLVRHVPSSAATLIDLGSGAGFPGLVLAELLRERVRVTLVEATRKKCEFLKTVAARLELNCEIRNRRIEDGLPERFDVITARACAPLSRLLGYAQHFSAPGTIALFLKGQNLAVELTEARKCWKIGALEHPSRTDPLGTVLEVVEFHHVQKAASPRRRQSEGRRR